MAAYDVTVTGSNGNDNLFYVSPGEISILVEALQGNDNVQLNSDLSNSSIGLDGQNDNLLITSTGSSNPTFRQSTVRAGDGNDTIEVRTRTGADLQIWGDFGSDNIHLTHVGIPGQTNNASFVRTTILADNPTGVGSDGIDTVYIDNHVAKFNYGLVDLGGNDNNLVAPVVNAVIDAIAKKAPLGLLNLGLEGLLVQAGEVYNSTFRGGAGSDWLVFDSLFNPFSGVAGTTALDTSKVNGNDGNDAIAILRNVDNSTICGGQGDDYITALSATTRFSVFNGNKGSDLITLVDLLSQNSSFYGGQGNDVINIANAVVTNTLVSGDLNNDDINFFALNSTNTTLSGGDGDDTIDDFSSAITTLGNVLDGGAGDDVLYQAANILFSGVTDFGSTIIGGTGADVMTGDSETQLLGQKQVNPFGDEINGASKDLFRFSFGDSVINNQGVGSDQITDFDSNASYYLFNGGDATNPFDFTIQAAAGIVDPLTPLQRDAIDLTNGDIKIGVGVNLGDGAGTPVINNKGLVLSGVDNITEFVKEGSLQATAGAAIVWTQYPDPFTSPAPFSVDEFRTSWLFISDGDGTLTNGDLLVQLTNVAFDTKASTGGLILNGGNITDMVAA